MKRRMQAKLMGRWMQAREMMVRECEQASPRVMLKLWRRTKAKVPILGWVCGFRIYRDVVVDYNDDRPSSYPASPTGKTHLVALLAADPDSRPIPVPVDALEDTDRQWEPREARYVKHEAAANPERWRRMQEDMRQYAKELPRDARGRFTKD